MGEVKPKDDELYPGVDAAYDFVLPSYQIMANRLEAADTRLALLLTMISSLALGVPLLARAVRPDIDFRSPFFHLAVALSALAFVCGVIGRTMGRIVLVNPGVLYQRFLRKSTWTFRKDILYFAGQHFMENSHTIDRKGTIATWMTIIMFLSVIAFAIWISH